MIISIVFARLHVCTLALSHGIPRGVPPDARELELDRVRLERLPQRKRLLPPAAAAVGGGLRRPPRDVPRAAQPGPLRLEPHEDGGLRAEVVQGHRDMGLRGAQRDRDAALITYIYIPLVLM